MDNGYILILQFEFNIFPLNLIYRRNKCPGEMG